MMIKENKLKEKTIKEKKEKCDNLDNDEKEHL